jgi:hypothetical protein
MNFKSESENGAVDVVVLLKSDVCVCATALDPSIWILIGSKYDLFFVCGCFLVFNVRSCLEFLLRGRILASCVLLFAEEFEDLTQHRLYI